MGKRRVTKATGQGQEMGSPVDQAVDEQSPVKNQACTRNADEEKAPTAFENDLGLEDHQDDGSEDDATSEHHDMLPPSAGTMGNTRRQNTLRAILATSGPGTPVRSTTPVPPSPVPPSVPV